MTSVILGGLEFDLAFGLLDFVVSFFIQVKLLETLRDSARAAKERFSQHLRLVSPFGAASKVMTRPSGYSMVYKDGGVFDTV